jgi:hypothetical protein
MPHLQPFQTFIPSVETDHLNISKQQININGLLFTLLKIDNGFFWNVKEFPDPYPVSAAHQVIEHKGHICPKPFEDIQQGI